MKKNIAGMIGLLLVVAIVVSVVYMASKNNKNNDNQLPQSTETPAMTTSQNQQEQVQSMQSEGSTSSDGYTMAQVAGHATSASCWSVIGGAVYDLTDWIKKHPGGDRAILGICGKDGTAAFTQQHGGKSKPEATLATFKIGTLAR